MSVFDKFINAIKLNEYDDLDDEEYFDEEEDPGYEDTKPRRRMISRRDEDPDEDLDDEPEVREYTPARSSSKAKPRSVRPAASPNASGKVSAFRPRKEAESSDQSNLSVCVIKPRSMEDAWEIAQTLLSGCTVILNLEGQELKVSQRIFDFASGACCAIRGNLEKISNYIFILTPHDVEITGEFQEILTGAFDSGSDDY